MDIHSSDGFQTKYQCVCNSAKLYAPGMWARHTATCARYKQAQVQKIAGLIEVDRQAKELASAKVASEAAAEAERARKMQREKERQEQEADLDAKEQARTGYCLRPARLRKPPRLFPGMVSSLRPPQNPPHSINVLPDLPTAFPPTASLSNKSPMLSSITLSASPKISPVFLTTPNSFGLVYEYTCSAEILSRITSSLRTNNSYLSELLDCPYSECIQRIISPFPNLTTFLFAHWFYTGGSNDTQAAADRLLRNVISNPQFNPLDLRDVSVRDINSTLDSIDNMTINGLKKVNDGWKTSTATIIIPTGLRSEPHSLTTHSTQHIDPGIPFQIAGFHHRSLTEVIRARFSSRLGSRGFTYVPYKVHLTKPGMENIRVWHDLFTCDAWLKEHALVQKLNITEDNSSVTCSLERAIVALMVSSDPTHVTQFSQTSVSPVYAYFGNQPKAERRMASSFSAEHIAYFPKLPAGVKDVIRKTSCSKSSRAPLYAHCKRELFHECWRILLDDDFVHAYHHGMVILCGDGVLRRLFPRFMTYSADYMERILIALIRALGLRPCPKCLVPMVNVSMLGTERDFRARSSLLRTNESHRIDTARSFIYRSGHSIQSKLVEDVLQPLSLVPTRNAFTTRLSKDSETPFLVNRILVPDLMHEFELGVWKSVFTHLIRMLETEGSDSVAEFNYRFRQVGSFGIDTIRKFSYDVSELKGFTAHDYEDALQCCMPCFAGLFTRHDSEIQSLVFVLMKWHFLAKLHIHTESTLQAFRLATKLLGTRLRHFRDHITSLYNTQETQKEYEKRIRRKAKTPAVPIAQSTNHHDVANIPLHASYSQQLPLEPCIPAPSQQTTLSKRQAKGFTLQTFKIHGLGDMVEAIEQYGTTESYSTQITEREHQKVKNTFDRTNYLDPTSQITKLERRETHLRNRNEELNELRNNVLGQKFRLSGAELEDPLHWGPSSERYNISRIGAPIRIGDFLNKHTGDPAIEQFIPRLRAHVLDRVTAGGTCSINAEENPQVNFVNGKLHQHNLLRINYTTYDIRRAREIINPKTCRQFALIRNTNSSVQHPFWYAKILAVLHVNAEIANATHNHPVCRPSQQINCLWVRWLSGVRWGSWNQNRLDLVGYLKDDCHGSAFGFVDPAAVVRGSYLIPAFEYGRTQELLNKSCAWDDENEGDWTSYWVMRFVDRDMGMRYFGGGIGHMDAPVYNDPLDHVENDTVDEVDIVPTEVLADPYGPSESEGESDDNEDNEVYD